MICRYNKSPARLFYTKTGGGALLTCITLYYL